MTTIEDDTAEDDLDRFIREQRAADPAFDEEYTKLLAGRRRKTWFTGLRMV